MLTLRFPGENWYPFVTAYANATISRGELIPIGHCVHPILIMSYDIDLILENIALEIITGGVSTANVLISSCNFWPKCLCTCPFDAI